MTIELLTALFAFAFVSSITPGPNNLMLMASGANFGFNRTLPHMLGVGIGFTLMIVLVGLGLMQLFDRYPTSYQVLKVISVVYLIYLAYKIANTHSDLRERNNSSKPLTFFQAAAFQWVNPKAWTMALSSISIYSPDKTVLSVLLIASVFAAVSVVSTSSWVLVGKKITVFLNTANRLKIFNMTMAILLLATLLPVLF